MSLSVSDPTPLSPQPAISTIQPSTARYVARTPSTLKVIDNALRLRASQDALVELKTLANIIQSSVEQIEAVVTANSFNFPSPESTFTFESEAPRMHPAIQSAGLLITSAAAQLMTLVRPAPLTLLDTTLQVRLKVFQARPWVITHDVGTTKYHVSTAIRTAVSTHVAEILRDAGPEVTLYPSVNLRVPLTLHYRENTLVKLPSLLTLTPGNWVRSCRRGLICFPLSMLPARILRLLATNHIFIEVSPDVFANNRLSSVLDTGKSVEELLARFAQVQ